MKIPTYTKPGKNPLCPYTNRFVCPSYRQSIHHLVTICCKPVKIPLQLWGEKCGKLPAQKPGKITIHQYIVCYICHCTRLCIICTTHPYIVCYVCHCTCPCIVCTTCLYIMHYVCHCTCPCIACSVCQSF